MRLNNGACTALLDLPVSRDLRGCDEAWRLQSAIDAIHHQPQEIGVREISSAHCALDVFAPLPRWFQRRWDLAGTPAQPAKGSLMTYDFPRDAVVAQVEFARTTMWFGGKAAGDQDG